MALWLFVPMIRSPSQWPGNGTVVDLGGTFADHHHVGDPHVARRVLGTALRPAAAQTAGQFTAELTAPWM